MNFNLNFNEFNLLNSNLKKRLKKLTFPGKDSSVVDIAETGRELRSIEDSVPDRTTTVKV